MTRREAMADKVKEIVDRYDPEGLLRMGCPEHEYRHEIEDISEALRTAETLEEFEGEVVRIWHHQFYTYDNLATKERAGILRLQAMAKEIWDLTAFNEQIEELEKIGKRIDDIASGKVRGQVVVTDHGHGHFSAKMEKAVKDE